MDILDKETILVSAGPEWYSIRFHFAIKNGILCKIAYFVNFSYNTLGPQFNTINTMEIKLWITGGYCIIYSSVTKSIFPLK